ncbi:hypothetical protein ACQEWB_39750 [Streptomyces sp. CA-249302]|uniref:hypothetical protein n=1 Tax=Streptomyces sp. CA-249302 TaxID=3240058 RepID=UPI003D89F385
MRRSAWALGAAIAAPSFLSACANSTGSGASASASSGGASSSAGTKLTAFDPKAPAGKAPDLPKRLALANAGNVPLFLNVAKYMKQACEDRGLEFLTAIYNFDAGKQVSQTDAFFQRGIGALVEEPVNIEASNPQMIKALDMGMCSIGVQRPYSHCQIAVNQYGSGYGQGIAAVEWIKKNLGGRRRSSISTTRTTRRRSSKGTTAGWRP